MSFPSCTRANQMVRVIRRRSVNKLVNKVHYLNQMKIKVRIGPLIIAFILTMLFIMAAEAEAPIHILAAAWLSFAAALLMLAIWRLGLLGKFFRANCRNERAAVLRIECDTWGVVLSGTLIVTGLALLYLLD